MTMGIKTADLMTTDILVLDPDMTLHAMDTMLVKSGVSGAPVAAWRSVSRCPHQRATVASSNSSVAYSRWPTSASPCFFRTRLRSNLAVPVEMGSVSTSRPGIATSPMKVFCKPKTT